MERVAIARHGANHDVADAPRNLFRLFHMQNMRTSGSENLTGSADSRMLSKGSAIAVRIAVRLSDPEVVYSAWETARRLR